MSNIINVTEYTELTNAVQAIKGAILQSQQQVLTTINQEQLAFYYGIGRFVSVNILNKNWGKGFIEVISEQLRKELLGLKCFFMTNSRKMRTPYEEWQILSDNSFVGMNELPTVQFYFNKELAGFVYVKLKDAHSRPRIWGN